MTEKTGHGKEIPVPARLIEYVDRGVRDKLPPGTQVHGIQPSGASYWSRTAMIDATDADGNPTPFFIKVHHLDHGKDMIASEYAAMSLLHDIVPDMVPEPLAWGAYTETPEVYFFLSRFHDFSDDIPRVDDFPALVAKFHRLGASPTGEFGFPTTTYVGRNPQVFPLSKSWEQCFTQGIEKVFELEEQAQGPDDELHELRESLLAQVIPRLLRPLETERRTLMPTLVHGDLWDGNASVDITTGHPMFFGAAPLYAHNEYELAPWWLPRHKMTRAYINEYNKQRGHVSEPVEDFPDRGALYSLRFDLQSSSLHPGNLRYRLLAKATMRDLIQKYPLGYEGYRLEKGLPPATPVEASKQTLKEAHLKINWNRWLTVLAVAGLAGILARRYFVR